MEIEIPSGNLLLKGELLIPPSPLGLVIFVHGSGSSRFSPRNIRVSKSLNQSGFATLLFDLLTEEEEWNRENVFDIELLAKRLIDVTTWVRKHEKTSKLKLGYFGASTGAAAALVAETLENQKISAIVSRGGRVDLANGYLERVKAPTLMIVGEEDQEVLKLNKQAQERLTCINKIEIVQNASHLFEEPGTLDQVTELTTKWFLSHI